MGSSISHDDKEREGAKEDGILYARDSRSSLHIV